MDGNSRKKSNPIFNPRKSQGLNEKDILIDQNENETLPKISVDWMTHQNIHAVWESLDEKPDIKQPQFRTNCIETILVWLDHFDIVYGMQMNFTHPDVLHKLSQKACQIIIQHHSWMDNAEDRKSFGIKRNFALAKKFYPLLNWKNNIHETPAQKFMERVEARSVDDNRTEMFPANELHEKGMGVGIFRHIPRDNEYPALMHHKFLIGQKSEPRNNQHSVIYGSFNLSQGATNNMESILVWEDNSKLAIHLHAEMILACATNQVTTWEDFVQTEKFIENDRDYPNVYV